VNFPAPVNVEYPQALSSTLIEDATKSRTRR
jgi:hypothetical protein